MTTRSLRVVERAILKTAISLVDRQGWIAVTWRKRDRLEALVAEYHASRRARSGKGKK